MYSIIIPVYNRPNEVEELLNSLSLQNYNKAFEVVIVEDGSTESSASVVEKYREKLQISYFQKENSGPGDSRNYGMKKAQGDYFLLFDSDCIIPKDYLTQLEGLLSKNYVDCFGGTDSAQENFSNFQKAINYSMTSKLTTGGVRGNSENVENFQPRSFNMGLSKSAFEATGGFGDIHPGEDPELVFRLWKLGYKTTLFKTLSVYHKRRIDFGKFYTQVNKFGKVRPILDVWHPEYSSLKFLFPTLFIIGFDLSILLAIFGFGQLLALYAVYFVLIFFGAVISTKSIQIAFLSLIAVCIQFYGYGKGYLESSLKIKVLKRNPKEVFPKLFFKR